VLSAGRRSIR